MKNPPNEIEIENLCTMLNCEPIDIIRKNEKDYKNNNLDQIAENKKKNSGNPIRSIPDYRSSGNNIPTSDVIPGGSTAPQQKLVYSGERKLLGVATMHKSNMVPVFDTKDAKDIAQMRRN